MSCASPIQVLIIRCPAEVIRGLKAMHTHARAAIITLSALQSALAMHVAACLTV